MLLRAVIFQFDLRFLEKFAEKNGFLFDEALSVQEISNPRSIKRENVYSLMA